MVEPSRTSPLKSTAATLSVNLPTLNPLSILLLKLRGGMNLTGMRGMSLDQLAAPEAKGGITFDTQFLRRHFSKVVIQETSTGRFWQHPGVWTADTEKATSFRTCSAALEQATHLKLQNVQLVLTREIRECEVIPLKMSFRV